MATTVDSLRRGIWRPVEVVAGAVVVVDDSELE